VYKALVEKAEEKKALDRPRRRWVDGIRMDLGELCWGEGWSGFTWLRIEAGGGLL
jgi:hypothetical protein